MRQSTATIARSLSTPDLWSATHNALTQGRLSQAQVLCEALAARVDNTRTLSSAVAYGVPETVADLLQDRIDAVNVVATR